MAVYAVELNQALFIAVELVVPLDQLVLQVLNALILPLEILQVAIKVAKFRKEFIESFLIHF